MRMTTRQVCRVGYGRPAIVAMLSLASTIASADWVNINPAPGEVIMRVNAAGVPTVSFTVLAAQLGNGTPIQGTVSTGNAYLEFEMSGDRPNPGGPNLTVTMTATAPATIGGTIPVSKIYWTSVAIPGAPARTVVIANNPAGFVAGANTIVQINATGPDAYAGGRLTFWYRNDDVYAAGTYGPTAINYTATRNP